MKNLIYYKLMFLYFAISGCLKRIRRYQLVNGWTLFYVEILPASTKATKGNFNHAWPNVQFCCLWTTCAQNTSNVLDAASTRNTFGSEGFLFLPIFFPANSWKRKAILCLVSSLIQSIFDSLIVSSVRKMFGQTLDPSTRSRDHIDDFPAGVFQF